MFGCVPPKQLLCELGWTNFFLNSYVDFQYCFPIRNAIYFLHTIRHRLGRHILVFWSEQKKIFSYSHICFPNSILILSKIVLGAFRHKRRGGYIFGQNKSCSIEIYICSAVLIIISYIFWLLSRDEGAVTAHLVRTRVTREG